MERTIKKKVLQCRELEQCQQTFASIIAELKHIGRENFKEITPTLQDTLNYLKRSLESEDLSSLVLGFDTLDYDAIIESCEYGIKELSVANYYK